MDRQAPHCSTCQCETPAERQARQERERRADERQLIRNHAILTDEDRAWARDFLAGKR